MLVLLLLSLLNPCAAKGIVVGVHTGDNTQLAISTNNHIRWIPVSARVLKNCSPDVGGDFKILYTKGAVQTCNPRVCLLPTNKGQYEQVS